jgi:hypothetical protein
MGRVKTIPISVDIGYQAGVRRQRAEELESVSGGHQWPELRIGRIAAPQDESLKEWNNFQNEFGSVHNRLGHARVISQVACHYILDGEMSEMVNKKYDKRVSNRQTMQSVYRGISQSLQVYIRSEMNHGSHRVQTMNYGWVVPERTANGDEPLHFQAGALHILQPEKAVKGYTARELGLRLGQNEYLFDERERIVRFLKREEKLDTSILASGWEPHATIFVARNDLRLDGRQLDMPLSLPTSLWFSQVKTLS